jgi:hypothetical protein
MRDAQTECPDVHVRSNGDNSNNVVDVDQMTSMSIRVDTIVASAGISRDPDPPRIHEGDRSTVMSPHTVVTWAENATLFHHVALAFRLTFLNRCEDEPALVAEY